jgi:phage FluMu protein Com
MPPINKYKCNYCDFSFPDGWGGYFYVEVDKEFLQKRIRGLEDQLSTFNKILDVIKALIAEIREALLRHFSEKVLPLTLEAIHQIRFIAGTRQYRLKELEERVERLRAKGVEDDPILVLLRELEDLLEKEIIGGVKSQLRELKEVEYSLRSKGLHSIRLRCPHPNEFEYAMRILGVDSRSDLFKSRTGFNSYVVCLECLHQFEADLRDEKVNEWRLWYGRPPFEEAFRGKPKMKDERRCPKCGSRNVRTAFEMIGEKCPKCKTGIIVEIETGVMT